MRVVGSVSFNLSERYAVYAQYQSITWYSRSGYDGDGKPSYAAGVSIDVRRVQKRKLVKDQYGNEVVSDTVFMVTDAVLAEDKLGSDVIITTEEANNLYGVTAGKLVYI